MIHEDWFMRQLDLYILTLVRLLLGKESAVFLPKEQDATSEADYIWRRLLALLAEGKLGEAEDLLFEELDPNNQEYLAVGFDFYQRMNQLTDRELEKNDFSREEIEEGLQDLVEAYHLQVPKFRP